MTTGLREEYSFPRLHFRTMPAAGELAVIDDNDSDAKTSQVDAESDKDVM